MIQLFVKIFDEIACHVSASLNNRASASLNNRVSAPFSNLATNDK